MSGACISVQLLGCCGRWLASEDAHDHTFVHPLLRTVVLASAWLATLAVRQRIATRTASSLFIGVRED